MSNTSAQQQVDQQQRINTLAERILAESAAFTRYIVAIAGPPASGKSTLTDKLHQRLATQASVQTVPMDGFHFDNAVLEKRNRLDRKGAPDTFDVAAFKRLLNDLQDQHEPLAVPVFDRQLDLSRGSAQIIEPDDHIILVEGNYLLTNTDPWNLPADQFNLTMFLKPPPETLEQRLIQRWLDHDHSLSQAQARARHNDLPNAEYVIRNARRADIEFQ